MTPKQMQELLPVANAYAQGQTVQWASQSAEDWRDYATDQCAHHQPCIFLNPRFRWRVKPTRPREWWGVAVREYQDMGTCLHIRTYDCESSARKTSAIVPSILVKVVEVLE